MSKIIVASGTDRGDTELVFALDKKDHDYAHTMIRNQFKWLPGDLEELIDRNNSEYVFFRVKNWGYKP